MINTNNMEAVVNETQFKDRSCYKKNKKQRRCARLHLSSRIFSFLTINSGDYSNNLKQ